MLSLEGTLEGSKQPCSNDMHLPHDTTNVPRVVLSVTVDRAADADAATAREKEGGGGGGGAAGRLCREWRKVLRYKLRCKVRGLGLGFRFTVYAAMQGEG